MVANRDSIAKVGLPLCNLIIEGEGGSAKAMELAGRLQTLLGRSGTYRKKYEDPQERVLHRHLNLYKNKLAAAKTSEAVAHWTAKLSEQRAKIREFEGRGVLDGDMDLDGL